MRDYELVYIISPGVTDEDIPAIIEKVSSFVASKGGAITNVNQWGRKRLAYPIRDFKEGNYVVTQFKLAPERAAELEASLRISEDIIRHLLVRLGE